MGVERESISKSPDMSTKKQSHVSKPAAPENQAARIKSDQNQELRVVPISMLRSQPDSQEMAYRVYVAGLYKSTHAGSGGQTKPYYVHFGQLEAQYLYHAETPIWRILVFSELRKVRQATEEWFIARKSWKDTPVRSELIEDWRKIWGVASHFENLKFKSQVGRELYIPACNRILRYVRQLVYVNENQYLQIIEAFHGVRLVPRKKQGIFSTIDSQIRQAILALHQARVGKRKLLDLLIQSLELLQFPNQPDLNSKNPKPPYLVLSRAALSQRVERALHQK